MIINRLEPSEKIPAELREIYAHLAGNLIDTLGVLEDLRILYGTSEKAIELMNKVAATFFVRHEQLLIHHIILFVSRATDERESGPRKKRQENLTLDRLLDLPNPEHEKLRIDLQKRLTVIKSDAKPMRLYRHKLLGHASLKHHLLPSTELGKDITLNSMKAILEKIGEYLETFEGFFTGVVGAEFYYPPSHGEARDLLEYLKLAVEAEEKENEERLRAAMG
jgi:hypothetical protein